MENVRATPIETMELACRIGRQAALRFVYSGNLPGCADERTHCPNCRELLIDRQGYFVRGMYLRDGRCPKCNETIEGIWAHK
jgi:pyruvate formate lyase activating enzyme